MTETLEEFARLFRESEDPRFQMLHLFINNLHLDLNFFKENFKITIKNLNDLFNQELISQKTYDNVLHTLATAIVIYQNNKIVPVDILVYDCCVCKKYFLEMDGLFLKEEIPTKIKLNYTSSNICSERCVRNYYPTIADELINNSKTKAL